MVDFMNDPLHDILREVAEDGVVDQHELEQIQNRLLMDEVIDQEEVEFLFAIADIVFENGGNAPDFEEFFMEAVTCFVLNDPLSPGVLDEDEWFWLKAMVAEDGDLGEVEQKLLLEISERATSIPEDFFKFAKQFEEMEYEGDIGTNTTLFARMSRNLGKKIEASERN